MYLNGDTAALMWNGNPSRSRILAISSISWTESTSKDGVDWLPLG